MSYDIYSLVLPLFTYFSSALLGAWALTTAPKSTEHRVFAMLTTAVTVWAAANFGFILSPNSDAAMFWSRVIGFGWVFMGPIFLHLVLLLTGRGVVFANRLSYLALYGPGIVFLGMFWLTGAFYSGVQATGHGYVITMEKWILAPGAYLAVSIALSLYCSLKAYREFSGLERTQIGMVTVAIAAPAIGSIMLYGVLPLVGVEAIGLEPIILFPPAIAVMAIAIVEYKLFSPPPISRFILPLPEMELRTKPKFKLERGRSYLVTEDGRSLHRQSPVLIRRYLKTKKPSRGLAIFMDQITHGTPGLWITSFHPKQVERYRLKRTPIIYLTTGKIKGEVTLPLDRIDKAKALVSNYFLRVRGRSVVFIDGLEKLVGVNGLEHVLKFLKEMKELCSKNNSNLIVQVN